MRVIKVVTSSAIVGAMLAFGPIVLAAQSKDQIEAAAQYERALVFFQQGAYKEAEQAFRQAEKKDDKNLEYQLAIAYTYLKLHKPDDAVKRYSKIYKNDPTHLRAIVGLAASYEEMQNYREAVRMWMRYTKMNLTPAERDEGLRMLRTAQDLFVARYEIAENPAGGAANAASAQQEQQWGLEFAREIAASGVPLLADGEINAYVKGLCDTLVPFAKQFPARYDLFVLDSPTVNAQTTPGFIFVYRGILETVTSEAELAGVLAHEMSHTIAHHGGKKLTKAAQDRQTLETLQSQDTKLAKFLSALVALGNPLGELSFSREQEAQADRLGIHIAYDAGYDPRALAELFQKFESMQPSSRKSWDLMARTHPFSIDRLNAVNDYVPLLPERPLTKSSPAFERMKARLKSLPPAPVEAPAPAPERASVAASGHGVPFTIENAPFAGEVPATWTGRKSSGGTIVFEGQKGTEAYEATVEVEIAPHATLPGKSLDDVAQVVFRGIAEKPNAKVQPPEARNDGALKGSAIRATYSVQANQGMVAVRHLSVVINYPDHFVIFSYFAPDGLFDKYLPTFQQIGDSFRYTGR